MSKRQKRATEEAYIDEPYSEIEVLSMHDFKSGRKLKRKKDIEHFNVPGGRPSNLNKGGMSCPYRESSSKNSIPGNNDIQIKGFKFTGVK